MITDNLPDQINGVNTTYTNIEPYAIRDGYTIHTIHPGCFRYIDCPKYNEVKFAWGKNIGQKIEEISPDYIHIQTEGPWVCGLEHIFHWAIFVTIPLITLSFLKGSKSYLEYLSLLPGVLYDGFINIVARF